MTVTRVDPLKPAWRSRIAEQVDRVRESGAAVIRQRVLEAVAARLGNAGAAEEEES